MAIDDCGNIINPMIVEGQVHGGFTMGLGPALYEEIQYDESGNIMQGSFMNYLPPTAVETPNWETANTSRHRRIIRSARRASASQRQSARLRRSSTRWLMRGISAYDIDIPITSAKVWKLLRDAGVRLMRGE